MWFSATEKNSLPSGVISHQRPFRLSSVKKPFRFGLRRLHRSQARATERDSRGDGRQGGQKRAAGLNNLKHGRKLS